jgi:hypothetical protein
MQGLRRGVPGTERRRALALGNQWDSTANGRTNKQLRKYENIRTTIGIEGVRQLIFDSCSEHWQLAGCFTGST